MSSQSPSLRHRPSRTVPATITALVLLAAGVLSIVAAILRLADGSWPAPALGFGNFLTRTRWGEVSWLLICIGLALLGLIMIIAAVKPGRVNATRLAIDIAATNGSRSGAANPSGETAETELVISRRGVARLAAARAESVDGVDSVTVNAASRRVRLDVDTSSQRTAEIERDVTNTVTATLSELGLTPMPRISTTARVKES